MHPIIIDNGLYLYLSEKYCSSLWIQSGCNKCQKLEITRVFFRLSRSPIASGICLQGLFAHTLRIQRSRCGGMFMRQGCACRLPRLDIKRAASTSAQCRWPAERGNWQLLHANVSLGHAHPLTGASRSAWKSQKENKMWMTSAGEFVHTETEYQSVKPISQCYLRPSDARIQGIVHKLHFFSRKLGSHQH